MSLIPRYDIYFWGRQHRKDIDLNLKPFRGNYIINNYIFHTKKNEQFVQSKKLLINIYYYYYYYHNDLDSTK